MEAGLLVHKTISTLKQRLEKHNNLIEIQNQEGYLSEVTCLFMEPLTEKELDDFETRTEWYLPKDYREFLKITNGMELFTHPYYGGENTLHQLNMIYEIDHEDPFEGCFKIGYFYGDNLVINSEIARSGDPNYLFVKGKIDQYHEARSLNMNFELWLDRFVICQGTQFWDWPIFTASNYYK